MKPDDLFTILRNLLENAVRYSPKGGTVTVKLAQIEPPVLCVMDEGPGIPQEDRARVLEPFYRRLGTNVSGTGLGLAIVKTICDLRDAQTLVNHWLPVSFSRAVCLWLPAIADVYLYAVFY